MTEPASNLSPDFDEAGLLALAAQYDDLAAWIRRPHSKLVTNNLDRAVMLRRAVVAYDTLRERCLMAEHRERVLIEQHKRLMIALDGGYG